MPAKQRHLGRKDARLAGQSPDGKPLYLHPAHPYHLSPAPKTSGWLCEICLFRQLADGEQRQRIKSVEDRSTFNICAQCLNSDYDAWFANQRTFVAGNDVVFAGVKYMGELPVDAEWPAPDDLYACLERIDRAQADGDLPYRSKERRQLHFSHEYIKVATDPDNVKAYEAEDGFQVFHSWLVTHVASVSYYDDHPQHILCIIVSDGSDMGTAHFLQCVIGELAEAICHTIQEGLHYVLTQSLMEHMDDSIAAGVEGRPTLLETRLLAAERAREQAIARRKAEESLKAEFARASPEVEWERSRSASPVAFGVSAPSPVPAGQDERRKSIFDVFSIDSKQGAAATAAAASAAAAPTGDRGPPQWAREASGGASAANKTKQDKYKQPKASTSPPSAPPTRATPAVAPPASSGDAITVVQDYMAELQKSLDTTELRDFALLLRHYRTEGDFDSFTSKLVELYGPSRQHLVPGLEAFIPPDDKVKFHSFLLQHH
eukprot:m.110908 g.110908  ORF g.110908 m.110908 type:complete len:489 (+) comp16087_c0_seq3:155-1621(+)